MPKLDLTVCVLALNEEKNLDRCLESVKDWAGEIVAGIDDRTVDKSEAVAKKYTDKVSRLKHEELFHINKQKVVDKAKKRWVLWLDADEWVSPKLAEEIKTIVKTGKAAGYLIPRKNYIFNKWIEQTGWYPDYQLRLWKRGKVHWPCQSIHEDPVINGETDKLTEPLEHENYVSVSQYLEKLNRYTSLDAKRLRDKIKPPYFVPLLTRSTDEFIKRFIALKGYQDGLHGLVLALLQAFYELVVVVKVWELDKFRDEEKELIKNVEKQGKKLLTGWNWWKREIKIEETKNKLKRVWHKGMRKLGR